MVEQLVELWFNSDPRIMVEQAVTEKLWLNNQLKKTTEVGCEKPRNWLKLKVDSGENVPIRLCHAGGEQAQKWALFIVSQSNCMHKWMLLSNERHEACCHF